MTLWAACRTRSLGGERLHTALLRTPENARRGREPAAPRYTLSESHALNSQGPSLASTNCRRRTQLASLPLALPRRYQGVMLVLYDVVGPWSERRGIVADGPWMHAASVVVTVHLFCFGLLIFSGRLFGVPFGAR